MSSITLGEFKPTFIERQSDQKKYLDQLASGRRVNNAKDDPTAFSIASRLLGDFAGLTNTATGQAVINIADGGLSNAANILTQLKSIATLAQSGTASPADLANLDAQFTSLKNELNSNASSTSFNGQSLLDGTSPFATGVNVQVGAGASDTIAVSFATATSTALGLSGSNVASAANASAALTAIDTAISTVAGQQAQVGAFGSQFQSTSDQLAVSLENTNASISTLLDADIGSAVTKQTSASILNETTIAALARDNAAKRKQLISLLQ